jgi:hypothetical protein
MAHPLDGVQLKCERAHHHLKTLKAEFDAFTRDAYSIRHEVKDGGREHVYRVVRLKKTRPEWGPIIGDCLGNAASALDHLAYQLAILHTGTLTPALARDTRFPIYGSPRDFWNNLPRLRAIGPDQVVPLERLQPYHGMRAPDDHWLMILKRLSDFDKHRTLHTTSYRFGGMVHHEPDSLIDAVFPTGQLKLGADLARFVFNPPDSEIDVDPRFTVDITFKDTPLADGVEVEAMLNTICACVDDVVDEFRSQFR